MKKTTRDEWDATWAPSFWALIQASKQAQDPLLKKRLKEGLKRLIYRWTDRPSQWVSRQIIARFQEQGIDRDPFQLTYADRKLLGRDEKGRTHMLWEHTTTNHQTYLQMMACRTQEELLLCMRNHSGVCWITREEDQKLNRMGYRSQREAGWESAYRECGIEVVPRPGIDTP